MDLVESLSCGCKPGAPYASRATFRAHLGSNRHRAWLSDRSRLVAERSETMLDVVTRRLEKSEQESARLGLRVAELEAALFGMRLRRSVSEPVKKKVASDQAWRCASCSSVLSHVYEIDHVTPLFMGGSNERENLQALCRECHGVKTARDKDAFLGRGPERPPAQWL